MHTCMHTCMHMCTHTREAAAAAAASCEVALRVRVALAGSGAQRALCIHPILHHIVAPWVVRTARRSLRTCVITSLAESASCGRSM